MTFYVDISNTFELCSTRVKNYVWKITKVNNSKIMKGRVTILVHCTPPEWDLCTYEVSCWYLKGFLSYARFLKITKGNNSKIMQGRVIILVCTALLNEIHAPMKFQVDTSNTFWDMLRTKMSDGRSNGRTEIISISPAAFSAGDNNFLIRLSPLICVLLIKYLNWLQIR
jgi:hypothetical protein